ncbi:EF-hand calcium-binding domain-containing protein 8 [Sorex araneus]|uniref:EF-hand calcium-binding domain-containing protein 8 n=1 Tax=Sorex araneus TaxID=42254 RepID=UPI002433565A|nr:EF-hand calcium-binding domain-containing protein 8 [Sorex araneus]
MAHSLCPLRTSKTCPFEGPPPARLDRPLHSCWWDFPTRSKPFPPPGDVREDTPAEKLFTPTGFQEKVSADAFIPSLTPSQMVELQQEYSWLTELPLDEMEKMFETYANADGGLDRKMFVKGTKKVLGHMTDDRLHVLFLKVDTDCDGIITWEEYVDYVMREFQGKETKRRSQYRLRFQLPMKIIPQSHRCEIVKVQYFVPRLKKFGCFVTVTKDGCLETWSESFILISSFRLTQLQQSPHQQMWVTDMVCLHNMNLVAVASTEQKIEFYDISDFDCIRAFTFIDLDSCVMVMDYWSDYHRGVFCYGDSKGSVAVFTSDNVKNGLFNPCILPKTSKWDRTHWTTVSAQKLLKEKSSLYRTFRLKALHPTWCQQVKFIPEMNLVASCAAIEKASLVLTMLPDKDSENPRFSVLGLRKGILCFDYCVDKNFLVTGGYDPLIRLWNPFLSRKPVWQMKGHRASVTHILISSKDSSILFSISKDKNIRVWDMLDYICLQSFCGRLLALGNCPITSAYFHKEDNALVCCTFSIGVLQGSLESQQADLEVEKTSTHNMPLCGALYSSPMQQVVSGCVSGTVMVWELMTGRKMAMFSVSGDEHEELTAMALDEPERCLITGLRDGSVKLWNYNNGECLVTLPNPDHMEISGIIHLNKVFYVAGWSKRINSFMFHRTKPLLLCYPWPTFHTDDILSMDKYQNQFLGTASYNGDIILWNIFLLKPLLSFNASQSYLALQPQKVYTPEAEEKAPEPQEASRPHTAKKWAERSGDHPGPSRRAGPNLWRNLVSAPPVMRHPDHKEMEVRACSPQEAPQHQWLQGDGEDPGGGTRCRGHGELAEGGAAEQGRREGWLGAGRELHPQFRSCPCSRWPPSSIEIIFLQTRPRQPYTAALLSSCTDGYLYAWSTHGSGGLLGKFPSGLTETENVVVGTMTTDKNDLILLTGDSKGQIKIWDIKDYCVSTGRYPQMRQHQSGWQSLSVRNKFQYLISKRIRTAGPYFVPLKPTEVVSGQTVSLVPPKLLISWKGHEESVVDIRYVNNFQLLITAGLDRDVKVWKVSGEAIGTFGLTIWKKLQMVDAELSKGYKDTSMFMDSSLQTLYEEQPGDVDLASALEYQRQEQIALLALLHMKGDMETGAWAALRRLTLQCPWGGERPLEDIENSWRAWESRAQTVNKAVGGSYWHRERARSPGAHFRDVQYGCMRHQISPRVFQSLPFTELAAVQQPELLQEALEQPGSSGHTVAHKLWRKLHPDGDTMASVASVFSSLFSTASGSAYQESTPTSSTLASSSLFLHSGSISPRRARPKSASSRQPIGFRRASSRSLIRKRTPVQF